MQVKTEFSVFLPNKPGQLAKLSRALARAGVNIQAISVNDSTHHGVVKLVVDKVTAASKALRRAKLDFTRERVLVLYISDEPGVLAQICEKLSRSGVNIDYVYGSTCDCTCDCPCQCLCVLSVCDIEAARKALAGG